MIEEKIAARYFDDGSGARVRISSGAPFVYKTANPLAKDQLGPIQSQQIKDSLEKLKAAKIGFRKEAVNVVQLVSIRRRPQLGWIIRAASA